MDRKTALVTGGTSGIGLSLVKALAQESCNIHFIGTNRQKGASIEEELSIAYKDSNLKFWSVDLSSLYEIQKFISEFKSRNVKLDLLANIAGALFPSRVETKEGLEKTFALSYLSAFFLCNELLPLIQNAKQGRIVNVAGKPKVILNQYLNFNDLNSEKNYNAFKASSLAVHAKTVLTESLANQLKNTTVTVNSFDPGFIKSNLFRNAKGFQKLMMKMASPFFAKESKSAKYACLSNYLDNVSGKLIVGKELVNLNFDDDYQIQLRKTSEQFIYSKMNTENTFGNTIASF